MVLTVCCYGFRALPLLFHENLVCPAVGGNDIEAWGYWYREA